MRALTTVACPSAAPLTAVATRDTAPRPEPSEPAAVENPSVKDRAQSSMPRPLLSATTSTARSSAEGWITN